MAETSSGLKRVVTSTGVYAAAAFAQKGLAFLLLPIYTRYIEPVEYGVLELLTAFASVALGLLMMGLPSAIPKCFHRDCETPEEQARVLPTSVWLDLPVLLICGSGLLLAATPLSRWLTGSEDNRDLVILMLANAALTGFISLFTANLRAEERAFAFSVLSLTQFLLAASFNIALVVHYGLGVRGVFWGNLMANALALPIGILMVRHRAGWTFDRDLAGPLLRFGLLMIPLTMASWIMDLSDRYVLRIYGALDDVAVYGVGYKFGMILQLAVVWPFQLAWPAVAFSISKEEGHRETYAQVLTYLSALLVYLGLALSILTRVVVPLAVGEGYRSAYLVVPLVALAYAWNGVRYCISPAVHIREKTSYLLPIMGVAALLNLGLNFLLIPRLGMMGAAWATLVAFVFLTLAVGAVAQHYYPVPYEYGRLAKVWIPGVVIFLVAALMPPELKAASVAWHVVFGLFAYPAALFAMGFVEERERRVLSDLIRRYTPFGG